MKDVMFDKHRMQQLTTFAFLAAIAGCPTCVSLGLIPDVPAPQAEGSVPMGDLRLFPELKLTVGNNDAIYAFCMTVPSPGTQLKIKSLGMDEKYSDKPVKHVSLLGYDGEQK